MLHPNGGMSSFPYSKCILVRDAYDRWTKANDKARVYFLASMPDILRLWSLHIRTWTPSERCLDNPPCRSNKRLLNTFIMHGSSSETKFAPSSSGSKKLQKKNEGKGKAKVAIKGKCFHCDVDRHSKRNCSKYLARKKKKEEGEMMLKVGIGDVISAQAVGATKLF
ncbi:gag/pol protein [Cucumis melo var. makuwa]|uniref:Gag/pol protein n=1 Tax=Cucumis melo var. makuwa TaxID=1194695 RepID=A0A5D3DUZ2_CUCMM|nr:gag/pol protein [Cucumis melo var. makuwa]TYK27332.1 gag/pol protein [Cucumis melo var. makuwa]